MTVGRSQMKAFSLIKDNRTTSKLSFKYECHEVSHTHTHWHQFISPGPVIQDDCNLAVAFAHLGRARVLASFRDFSESTAQGLTQYFGDFAGISSEDFV